MEKKRNNPQDFLRIFRSVKGKAEIGGDMGIFPEGMEHGKGHVLSGYPEVSFGITQSLQNAGCSGLITQKLRNEQNTVFTICSQKKSVPCIKLKLLGKKSKSSAFLKDGIFRQHLSAKFRKFSRTHGAQRNRQAGGSTGKYSQTTCIPVAHTGVHFSKGFLLGHQNGPGISQGTQKTVDIFHQHPA